MADVDTKNEQEEDPIGLSLNFNDEEDEEDTNALDLANNDEIRDQAKINSPKSGPTQPDQAAPTPGTQMRNKFGVNSPKGQPQPTNWNLDSDAGGGIDPSSIMTQVSRPAGGPESVMTQVPRPGTQEEDTTQTTMMTTTEKNAGLSGLCSCLWNCCSKPNSSVTSSQQQLTTVGASDGGEITNTTNGEHVTNFQKRSQIKSNSAYETHGANPEPRHQPDKSLSESSTIYPERGLLPPLISEDKGKKCLVLDLDETLVHSSFKPIPAPDFIIPVEIDNVVHRVYVLKRPFVDEFLLRCAKFYEIVIFTASLAKYADPLLDQLDINSTIRHRLFRESCVIHGTAYVKDLRKLGRKLKDSIIVDNSPPSYLFQPGNAVPIASWFDDPNDTQLRDFLPVLETTLKDIPDVRRVLDANGKSFHWLCSQGHQPIEKFM